MLDYIRRLLKEKGKDAVWKWCVAPDGPRRPCSKSKRFAAYAEVARKKRNKHPKGSKEYKEWEEVREIAHHESRAYAKKCANLDEANWPDSLPIAELLWQTTNHWDHGHVASCNRDALIKLCEVAEEKFGVRAGEFPPFDAVENVHVSGSYHYRQEGQCSTPRNFSNRGNGLAVDFSGGRLADFMAEVRQRYR